MLPRWSVTIQVMLQFMTQNCVHADFLDISNETSTSHLALHCFIRGENVLNRTLMEIINVTSLFDKEKTNKICDEKHILTVLHHIIYNSFGSAVVVALTKYYPHKQKEEMG